MHELPLSGIAKRPARSPCRSGSCCDCPRTPIPARPLARPLPAVPSAGPRVRVRWSSRSRRSMTTVVRPELSPRCAPNHPAVASAPARSASSSQIRARTSVVCNGVQRGQRQQATSPPDFPRATARLGPWPTGEAAACSADGGSASSTASGTASVAALPAPKGSDVVGSATAAAGDWARWTPTTTAVPRRRSS